MFENPSAAESLSQSARPRLVKNRSYTKRVVRVRGENLRFESLAGKQEGLGASQQGEVRWLEQQYRIALVGVGRATDTQFSYEITTVFSSL